MVLSMDRWVGKVAVVTGASAGIGSKIAERLVEEGLLVVGLARRIERIGALAKKLQGKKGELHGVRADVTVEKDIVNAFQWITENLGPVHILVNNAGIIEPTNLIDGNAAQWKKTFDTNVLGLCIATREAVKVMRANNVEGHIVHINSVTGHKIPNLSGFNVYPASKYAVTALTETLRNEFSQVGAKIKITDVSPGATVTEIVQPHTPKSEMLKTDDVADAVLYVLATPPYVHVHEMILKPAD